MAPLPLTRLRLRLRRELALRLFRKTTRLAGDRPQISFTFDDFPASAATAGGELLRERGIRATYYAAFGLINADTPTGRIFGHSELHQILADRHELGCHTFGHCAAGDTPAAAYQDMLQQNQLAGARLAAGAALRSHSYPISQPRLRNKIAASRRYLTCRGGGQTFNAGTIDLALLASYFLEKAPDIVAVRELILRNCDAGGWLIFSTHDVADEPTRFGVTPKFFAATLDAALACGARILPVTAAFEQLQVATADPAAGRRS